MARVETRQYPIDILIEHVRNGRLRVPRFQRQFVWRYEQVRDLFKSIERGYPIGTLLIWSTPNRYSSFSKLGPINLIDNSPPEPTIVGYLLDGHQRVSCLVGALSLTEEEAATAEGQTRSFILYYDLRLNLFVHNSTPREHYLPVRYLLDKTDALTRWIDERRDRTLPKSLEREKWDRYRYKAFGLQTIFSQARLPYLDITKADVAEAIKIFVLLNTKGTNAKRHEVFAALSWREKGFDFGAAARELMEVHSEFSNFRIEPILRALLVSLGESMYEDNWLRVEEKHRKQLPSSFDRVSEAFGRSVEFVKKNFGAASGKVLPYSLHLILLTEFFRLCARPTEQQRVKLTNWLWASSFSMAYSSATNIVVDAAVAKFQRFARNDTSVELLDKPCGFTPLPLKYHAKSARVRTFHLFLKHLKPRNFLTGKPFSDKLLSNGMIDGESLAGKIGSSWLISGRVLVPKSQRKRVVGALRKVSQHRSSSEILQSHLITEDALQALLSGDEDRFLTLRKETIVRAERDFARSYVTIDEDIDVTSEAIIDVDDDSED